MLLCLYLDKHLLEQQNTKELQWTKNNCMYTFGGDCGQQDSKRPKTQLPLLRSQDQNRNIAHAPLHSTPLKGWANHVSHSSSPSPGLTSIPSYVRNQLVLFPLVAQRVKNLPSMWETWVQYLGWEDPLEKRMSTHSNILAWRIPWTEEAEGLQSMGSQRVGHN